MKIVVFGLTISSSWGNGHATLWRALCRALHRRGHRIVFFERDVPYYAAHRDLLELPGGHLQLYANWDENLPIARRELAGVGSYALLVLLAGPVDEGFGADALDRFHCKRQRNAASRSSINQKGHYQTDLMGLAVEVKDSVKNPNKWA